MTKISWIYVIDNRGVPVFLYECYSQGAKDNNHALISRFLSQLQLLVTNLEINEIKEIKIQNYTYYITQDEETQYIFIIKPEIDAIPEKIILFLREIKILFFNKYSKHVNKSTEETRRQLKRFKDDVWKLIELDLDIGFLL